MDNSFKKKFLKGSVSTIIGQVASMIFHFVSIMILTREISKVDFGIYTLIIVISGMLLILSGLGLDLTLVKFMSGISKEERDSAFSKIFLIKSLSLLFFTILFLLLANILLQFIDKKILNYILSISVLLIFNGYRNFFYRVLQGLNYFKKYAISQISSAVVRFVLIVYYYFQNDLTIDNLIFTEILSSFSVVFLGIFFIPFRQMFRWKSDEVKTKTIINFSFPIYINDLSSFTMNRLNLFIVGALMNPISVAYYDVANKIPEALKKISDSFTLVFFPSLSNLISQKKKVSAQELINKSINIILLILTFGILISFLFRDEIITILFSEKYLEASPVFILLMINLALNITKNILGYSNLAAGYPKVPMKVNLVSGIISVTGAILLIPQFGYIGAAYSLLIMNIFAQSAYLYYLKKISLNIEVAEYLKPLVLLFITVGIFLFISGDSYILRMITITIFILANWIFIPEFKLVTRSAINIILKYKQ
ncbi:MAG: flippase [Promethearchaeota archaeon]|jgi:O-antigen/teichoic acid export membrane protein